MANTSNTRKKNAANKPAAAKQTAETVQNTEAVSVVAVANEAANEAVVEAPAVKAKITELPRDLYVPCVSMIRSGKLIYSSKRQMGYNVIWRNYMDTQFIEFAELMSMRSSDPMFFTENWIVIDDDFEYKDAVIEKLRIKNMYAATTNLLEFEKLFVLPIDEMAQRIKAMSSSLQENVYLHAKESVANGVLDSMKRIRAIEGALGKSIT